MKIGAYPETSHRLQTRGVAIFGYPSLSKRSDSDKTTALRLLGTTSPRIRAPWLAAEAQ